MSWVEGFEKALRRVKEHADKAALVGILVSVFFGGIAYLLAPSNKVDVAVVVMILGLLVTVVITVWGFMSVTQEDYKLLRTSISLETNDLRTTVTKRVEGLIETLEAQADIVFLGRATDAVKNYEDKLRHAQEVRNTFLTFDIGTETKLAEYVNSYKRAEVIPNITWKDILSEELLALDGLDLTNFLRAIKKQRGTKYDAKIIRNAICPIINFTLIEYSGGKEVLFGWGFHKNDPIGNVYGSKDQRLYETFDRYWSSLWENAEEVFPEGEGDGIAKQHIQGLWLTVSFPMPCREKVPTSRPDTVALLALDRNKNQVLTLTGMKFKCKASTGEVELDTRHNIFSLATHWEGRKLWVISGHDLRIGAGAYIFIKPGKDTGKSMWRLYGDFLDGESRTTIGVYGRKLDDRPIFPEGEKKFDYLANYKMHVLAPWS